MNRKFQKTILRFWLLLALSLWLPTALAQQSYSEAPVRALGTIGMTVADLDRSVDFYSKVLSFQKISEIEVAGSVYEQLQGVFGLRMRVVRMQLGDQFIELTEYIAPPGGRPMPADSRSNDLWFQHIAIVVSDMDKAYRQLRQHKVQHVSTNPQTIPKSNIAAAGIRAFKFRDPDGHNLELIYFPPGKGDRRWQRANGKLFLGIDHTAIAVSNTDTSLKFYRDLLGMKVVGQSLNVGIEQEHLDNVSGARVRITGLRPGTGPPGIEFLQYQRPTGGRPTPLDVKANDIMHWQTTLMVRNIEKVVELLRDHGYRPVSADVVRIPGEKLGFKKGFLVRDPDGHVMKIVE